MIDNPEFANPPVAEMAIGLQFARLDSMKAIQLGALRERWRAKYPGIEEHPPIPPAFEQELNWQVFPVVQFLTGLPMPRIWFISADGSELLQLQQDRFVINWRRVEPAHEYPRFKALRSEFELRYAELSEFVQSELGLGPLKADQVELTYVNVVGSEMGRIDRLLVTCDAPESHHLGPPEQARLETVYRLPMAGSAPARLYVTAAPGQLNLSSPPELLLTLTARGAPRKDALADALAFLDDAHVHLIRSFVELTTNEMHTTWGKQ